MKRRQWCPVLASFVLALLVAGPLLAGGERRPRGETSGSSSRTQASPPPSSTSPGNRPVRIAVPRSEQPRAQPRPQPQRQPQPDGERRPQGDDGRRVSSVHGTHHGPFYYPPYRWHPWGWGWWGGWYSPWWYYPYGGAYWYPERVNENMGALDLDLRPEKARVYLDGAPIGVADNFDGWPRELWLEEGTYDLVFYHEGFETIARQYSIYPGVVIQVEDRMEPGEAKLPEDLLARSSANREERLRRRVERGEEVADSDRMGWRERVIAERAARAEERPEAVPGDRDGRERAYDARSEPARLRLAVEPADAAIYLDGRFLGTGDEIDARAGLMVDPGDHELEVVRPGYESKTTTFTAESGEEVELTVELEPRAAGP